jgi:hypothetical protein
MRSVTVVRRCGGRDYAPGIQVFDRSRGGKSVSADDDQHVDQEEVKTGSREKSPRIPHRAVACL